MSHQTPAGEILRGNTLRVKTLRGTPPKANARFSFPLLEKSKKGLASCKFFWTLPACP